MFYAHLSVHLFVYWQDNSKSHWRIMMTFSGYLIRNNWLDFWLWSDLKQPVVLSCLRELTHGWARVASILLLDYMHSKLIMHAQIYPFCWNNTATAHMQLHVNKHFTGRVWKVKIWEHVWEGWGGVVMSVPGRSSALSDCFPSFMKQTQHRLWYDIIRYENRVNLMD